MGIAGFRLLEQERRMRYILLCHCISEGIACRIFILYIDLAFRSLQLNGYIPYRADGRGQKSNSIRV